MPGVLYVVATPIGNLEDITLRALRVLREATLIAAEDTRRTARLLQHYSISTPTTSLHEHNERARTPALLARLAAGDSIALVSDAGTPLVSDPGAHLVAAAHAAGVRVEPVPGPTAAMAALSASGLPASEFLFVGFPPSRERARKEWLRNLSAESRALILYEAPHRIRKTLEDVLAIYGNITVVLGRELTKVYEELRVKRVAEHLADMGEARGEYTVVLYPGDREVDEQASPPAASLLASEFGELTNNGGLSRREALKSLAVKHRIPSRTLYKLLEEFKTSGK